ncbi:MAG: hypothetical protein IKK93_07335 [Campylobacter sp.]|nr:hypothetical protein [Campylobacter sp.]
MSYRITEAERKHVAVIEDLKLNLSVTAEEGTTPAVNLEITDDDKLNLSGKFPQYAIEVDKTDDEHSRFRIVDAETRETIITCGGLTSLNGNPMGLGWRYGLEFILDEDNYVQGISLVNKNNENRNDKIITKLADMEIKSVTIPESDEVKLIVNSKAVFTKNVSINVDSSENALSVRNNSGKHASIGNVLFGDEYALKTNGDTKLAKVEVEDIELVGNDTEISVKADETTFRNTQISLGGVEIEGNNDSRIFHLSNLSSQDISANHINSDTIDTRAINVSTGTINTLSSGNINTSVLDATTGAVENLSSETITANNLTAENTTVHGRARFEGDTYSRALDVDGRLIAGEIKSLTDVTAVDVNATNVNAEKVVTNKAEIAVSEVVTEKANSIEARNLNVTRQMDALRITSRTDVDAARNVIAGSSVISDTFRGKDNKVVLEKSNESTIVLGNNNDQTIIKTASDPTKNVLEEEFGHVKAIVDGKEVFLANLEDVKFDRFDGYVNRSTNQDISGVKTFNDVLVAPAGIGIRDDEGHFRGMLSHVEDYSDVEFRQNPDYLEAQQEYNEYSKLRSAYDHLTLDYSNLMNLKSAFENAEADLQAAEEALASEREDDTNLRAEKDEIVEQIAEREDSLAIANTNLASKETQLAELQAAVSSRSSAYVRAQADLDNELADPEIMSIALRETLYFGRDFDDSFLQNNADYEYLRDEINCTNLSYANAIDAFNKMISILNILSGSTQDNVVAYCNVTKEHILNTLKPTIENNHAALVLVRDEALNALNDARTEVSNFENGELADANRAVALNNSQLVNLRAQLTQIETDIASNTYEIQRAENLVQLALENKTEKELDYSRYRETYVSDYENYSEKMSFDYDDAMIDAGNFPAPEMSENVRRFLNDEIPQTNYGPSETLHLGNSKDTLKIMSKGLHSGENIDQHIQTTIDGHDHILANVDDIVAKNVMDAFDVKYVDEHTGAEVIEKGKIVGDVSPKALEEGGVAITIGQAPVISGYKGQVLPEDQVQPSKIEKDIIFGSQDETVSITLVDGNKIDLSIGAINESLSNRIKQSYVNAKFDESSVIFTKEDGTEDALLLISTNDDLSIESLSDNILDINMNNFYNTEKILKEDILNLYDQVQPRDLRKVPNAFDVKVLTDAISARVDVLARNLENRLPVAPNEIGRYYLVANVRKNVSGETTSTYTWDGTGDLPEVHVPMDINDILGPEDYDADGNLFIPYEDPTFAEYGLKMRIIKTIDDVGNIRYTPRLMWIRIDDRSSDYSDSWLVLKNHPAVINAVSQGMDETEAIRALLSHVDSNGDIRVGYRVYDISDADGSQSLRNYLKSESYAKIGAKLADVVDFDTYNANIIVEDRSTDIGIVKFVKKINANTLINDIGTTANPFIEITNADDADILLGDGATICLTRKNSSEAYIGD